MSLWGGGLFLAAALLGGPGHAGLAQGPAGTTSTPAIGSMTAVLEQISPRTWKTTVLLDNSANACPGKQQFVLQTSPPNRVFDAESVTQVNSSPAAAAVSSCAVVTVTFFTPPGGVPASAALELQPGGSVAPTTVPLTVSRGVGLVDYLAVPAAAGAGLAFFLLLLVLYAVKIYDTGGSRTRPFCLAPTGPAQEAGAKREKPTFNRHFWGRTVSASGAWTVGDSWATNIGTVAALLGTVLTTTSAANSLFPGVALDRFALVNIVAGGIIAAAPLAFSALYARWISRIPGLTTECLVVPAVKLKAGCTATLEADTTVTWRGACRGLVRWLARDVSQPLQTGSTLTVPEGKTVILSGDNQVPLPASTEARLLAGTVYTPAGNQPAARVVLAKAVRVVLDRDTLVAPALSSWVRIGGGQQVHITGQAADAGGLAPGSVITLPDGAWTILDLPPDAILPGRPVTLLGGTGAELLQDAQHTIPDHTKITLPSGVKVALSRAAGNGTGTGLAEPPAIEITAPSGAEITAPGGAVIGATDDLAQSGTGLKDGGKIEVPPHSRVTIQLSAGRVMALPGGSDIVVGGAAVFTITCEGAAISVPGDNLAKPPEATAGLDKHAPDAGGQQKGAGQHKDADGTSHLADLTLLGPVSGVALGGVKITVAGAAKVTLPDGLAMTAPRRADAPLTESRHFIIPQGANTLVANMRLVIITAIISMFGIGAEIGITATLALLSDAAVPGRWVSFALIVAVGGFALWYGAAAIRTLADPQPGSSMSAAPGTSFTL